MKHGVGGLNAFRRVLIVLQKGPQVGACRKFQSEMSIKLRLVVKSIKCRDDLQMNTFTSTINFQDND